MRFPLYAKILLCFLINLLALAAAAWWISGVPFPPRLDSLLAGRAGDRIQNLSDSISMELHTAPREKWNEILKRFEAAYPVRFYLFANDGSQLAGDSIQLPKDVRARLTEPRPLRRVSNPEARRRATWLPTHFLRTCLPAPRRHRHLFNPIPAE